MHERRELTTALHLTARTTFVFFVCAFAGNALRDLWPGAISAWLSRQRDWFLAAVAASHTFHLTAIIAFFQVIGWSHLRLVTLIGGGSVYLLIYGLAVVAILRLRSRKAIFLFGRLKLKPWPCMSSGLFLRLLSFPGWFSAGLFTLY